MVFHQKAVFLLAGEVDKKSGSRKRELQEQRNANMKGYDLFPFCLGENKN